MSLSQARRQVPHSISLPPEVKAQLEGFRKDGGDINVSQIASAAIQRELERLQTGNRVVERLKVELSERRGPEWTAGYQEGKRWAENEASWVDITRYAIRYKSSDVGVEHKGVGDIGEPGVYEYEWLEFTGRFEAPLDDYGRDSPMGPGAPAYKVGLDDRGEHVREWDPPKCERFWRGWLTAVTDTYDLAKSQLPSVEDQLPPEPEPVEVNPDEIPF